MEYVEVADDSQQQTHPEQAGPPSQGWLPPGPHVQPEYGWPAVPTMPYGPTSGGAAPGPAARKRLPTLAILGLVALMVVVSIAGATGVLMTLGPLVSAGRAGLFGHQGHTTAPEPTPMSYNDDYLDTLDGSTSANWTTNQYCFFKDNAFHADPGPTNAGYLCPVPTDALYDLDVRVTVSQVSGPLNYGYGLMFRYEATGSYYLFLVDSDGQAWFGTASTGKDARQQELWNPTTFHRGLNAQNTIRVVATGPSLTFYVNGEQVGHLNDSTYRRGWVGFCSGGKNLDAAFTNLQVHGNR